MQQHPQTRAVLLHSHPGGWDQGEDQQGQYNGLVTRAAYNHSYSVTVETVRLGETHFEWVSPLWSGATPNNAGLLIEWDPNQKRWFPIVFNDPYLVKSKTAECLDRFCYSEVEGLRRSRGTRWWKRKEPIFHIKQGRKELFIQGVTALSNSWISVSWNPLSNKDHLTCLNDTDNEFDINRFPPFWRNNGGTVR